jgi:PAS domain S-box-containing protein
MEKLRESEEKYRLLVENLNEVIYALDDKGRITYISQSIESFTGYTPLELTGKHYLAFVHPDDKESLLKIFQRSSRRIDNPIEYRLIIKDNRIVWVSTAARPLLMEGRVTGVQGVLTDITEKKKAEKEKERSRPSLSKRRRWSPWGAWQVVWPTISTTSLPSSTVMPKWRSK